jgi:hypothetical protein
MSAPSQLNIVLTTGGNPTVVVPIPAALVTLDSNDTYGGGQAASQTGYASVDVLIRTIFKAGVFFVPSTNTWYPASIIQSITFQ